MDEKNSVYPRWLHWARLRYGDQAAVAAAYDSIMVSIKNGASQTEIVAAADESVRMLRLSTANTPISNDLSSDSNGKVHRGRVVGFQTRFESRNEIVWNFRVERTDADGKTISPVAVECAAQASTDQSQIEILSKSKTRAK